VCFTPGVGPATYARCYRGSAKVTVVDPTGDVVYSEEHRLLKGQAFRLAQEFNERMRQWLDASGRRACGPGERWDDYWQAMARVTEQVPAHPYVTSIMLGRPDLYGYDFHLHVPDPVDLTRALREHLCELAPQFGITARLRFKATSGDINARPRDEPSFACEGGKVAA
jgi:hypothetical protein